MLDQPRRRWVLAPIVGGSDAAACGLQHTSPAGDAQLVELLDRAYEDTIDFDPHARHDEELRTWREHDGADDGASFTAWSPDGRLIGAALVGRDLGSPFLYELAVEREWRRRGVARRLLGAAIQTLRARGEGAIAAWVTDGNTASEQLLTTAGFAPVTQAVGSAVGIGYYRAAAALSLVEVPATAAVAASSTPAGFTLWIIGGGVDETTVEVRQTPVHVVSLSETDERVTSIAADAVPIRRVSWLLQQRLR